MLTPRKLVRAAKDDVMVFENGTVLGSVLIDAAKSNGNSMLNVDTTSLVGNCENSESLCLFNNSVVNGEENSYMEVQNMLNSGAQSVESVTDETIRSEVLNSSTCSHDSRTSKRSRRKLRRCSSRKPPQYATIYLDTSSQGGAQPPGFNGLTTNLDSSHMPLPVPVPQRYIAETCASGRMQLRLFRVPSVPFVIGILALGGVACTLGGIVLGSTGLVEQSTQYLSAALLMIGIGVSLLVISGAIWKLTIGEETDGCSCCRHIDTCRNCNSTFCSNRLLSGHYIYPEFQHRTPPPSYLTSSNECSLGYIVRNGSTYGRNSVHIITPPPSYRSCSTNSLSAYIPGHSLMEVHQQNLYKTEASDSSGKEPIYVEIE